MARKIFVCVIISLMLISQAWGVVKKFELFSVDVPPSWLTEQQNKTLILKSGDGLASISVSLEKVDKQELSDVVEKLYLEREGVDLEQDDDGDYSFSFKDSSGNENIALITGGDDYYLLVTMAGFENEALQGDIETILGSIDWEESN